MRFLMANLLMMLCMVVLAPLMRLLISFIAGIYWGDNFGFPVAALFVAPASFMVMQRWVFQAR